MPRLNVTAPFKVKFPGEKKHREFNPGEHELTKAEMKHWFVQGCIADGRATLVDKKSQPAIPTAPNSEPLASEALAAMGPADIAVLTLEQIRQLTPAQVAALTTEQVSALTPEQLAVFSADQFDVLTDAQLAALGEEQLKTIEAVAQGIVDAKPTGK